MIRPPNSTTSQDPPQVLNLTVSASAGKTLVPFLRKYLPLACSLANSPLRELSLAIVGDRRMSLLHQQFMRINRPTDVLSFPLDSDRRGRVINAEIVICAPQARRQAAQRKIPLAHELLLYALHGMLHLSGFDDKTATQFRRMHRTEDKILTQLGIGATFAPQATPPHGKRLPPRPSHPASHRQRRRPCS